MKQQLQSTLVIPKKNTFEYSFTSMLKDAKAIADSCLDFEIRSPKDNQVRIASSVDKDSVLFRFGRDQYGYDIHPYAEQQLASKVGLPFNYYQKLRKSGNKELEQMAYQSMNSLLKYHQSPMMFRTAEGYLRGVVSTRYCRFDYDDVLDVLASTLETGNCLRSDNLVSRGYYSGLEAFHLRMTTSEPVKGMPDDDLYYGLELTSSDVGKYALRVGFFIYKKICTNGMCINCFNRDIYYQRHIGITKDGFRKGLQRTIANFPKLKEEVSQVIVKAGMISLEDNPLFDYDSIDRVDDPRRKRMQLYLGVGDEQLRQIALIASKKYSRTLWGYGNAITEWAQRHAFDRRLELEEKAGKLMTNYDQIAGAA